MWHRVKDLSSEQRIALEGLLGRTLEEDEGLNIQPSRIIQEAPTGRERSVAGRRYLEHLDLLASRVTDITDEELEATFDAACRHIRSSS